VLNRQKGQVIDPSTLAKIRKRLGCGRIEKINTDVTSDLISKKVIDGKILLTDTTCLEKNIAYPTEVSLLSRVIKEAALVSQNVKYKKDMAVNKAIVKAKQISKVYYSTSKKTDKLLKDLSQKLLSLAKDEINSAALVVNVWQIPYLE